MLCNPSNEVVVAYVGKDPEAIRQLFRWLDELDTTKLGEAIKQFAHCKGRIDRSHLTWKTKGKFIDRLATALKVTSVREVAPKHFKQKKINDLNYWVKQKSSADLRKYKRFF